MKVNRKNKCNTFKNIATITQNPFDYAQHNLVKRMVFCHV